MTKDNKLTEIKKQFAKEFGDSDPFNGYRLYGRLIEIWSFFEPHLATEEHDREIREEAVREYIKWFNKSSLISNSVNNWWSYEEYLKGLSKEKE